MESHPYSEDLKRLLIINTKDCLDNKTSEVYNKYLREATLPYLVEHGFIKIVPKMLLPEHEEIKSYIIISFDNFTPSGNPQFRDCVVHFDIICHTDYWVMNNYQIRPLKIAGYIDGILNNAKLTGIGTLNFIGCKEIAFDEVLSGYTLSYRAVHGTDDQIPDEE